MLFFFFINSATCFGLKIQAIIRAYISLHMPTSYRLDEGLIFEEETCSQVDAK